MNTTEELKRLVAENKELVKYVSENSNTKLFWDFHSQKYGPPIDSTHMSQVEAIAKYCIKQMACEDPWAEFKSNNQGIVLNLMVNSGLLMSKMQKGIEIENTYVCKVRNEQIFKDEKGSIFYAPTQALINRAKKYFLIKDQLNFDQ